MQKELDETRLRRLRHERQETNTSVAFKRHFSIGLFEVQNLHLLYHNDLSEGLWMICMIVVIISPYNTVNK